MNITRPGPRLSQDSNRVPTTNTYSSNSVIPKRETIVLWSQNIEQWSPWDYFRCGGHIVTALVWVNLAVDTQTEQCTPMVSAMSKNGLIEQWTDQNTNLHNTMAKRMTPCMPFESKTYEKPQFSKSFQQICSLQCPWWNNTSEMLLNMRRLFYIAASNYSILLYDRCHEDEQGQIKTHQGLAELQMSIPYNSNQAWFPATN